MTPSHLRQSNLVRSVLYPYAQNRNGAWDGFLHVRIQNGRPHPSPRHFQSIEAGDCTHA